MFSKVEEKLGFGAKVVLAPRQTIHTKSCAFIYCDNYFS